MRREASIRAELLRTQTDQTQLAGKSNPAEQNEAASPRAMVAALSLENGPTHGTPPRAWLTKLRDRPIFET